MNIKFYYIIILITIDLIQYYFIYSYPLIQTLIIIYLIFLIMLKNIKKIDYFVIGGGSDGLISTKHAASLNKKV